MTPSSQLLAIAFDIASAAVFYLGCPNQQWSEQQRLPFFPALLLSLTLAALSAWLFHFTLSPLPTVFALLGLWMLSLGIVPFLSRFAHPSNFAKKPEKTPTTGPKRRYQMQWRLRVLTATALGLPIALALSGLLAWWAPGSVSHDGKSQLVMWLVTPLWLIPMSLIFFAANATRVLAAYAFAGIAAFSLLRLAKALAGA